MLARGYHFFRERIVTLIQFFLMDKAYKAPWGSSWLLFGWGGSAPPPGISAFGAHVRAMGWENNKKQH